MKLEQLLALPNPTIDDLIQFYQEIPEDRWTEGKFLDLNDRPEPCCCAVGHLGYREGDSPENPKVDIRAIEMLNYLEIDIDDLISMNDQTHPIYLCKGNGPKERVINYLTEKKHDTGTTGED